MKSKLLFHAFIYNLDMSAKSTPKVIFADNKKALFDYEIIEEYEVGLKLFGEDVKSIRNGSINLKWSYVLINKWHPYATGIHIGEYKWGTRLIEPKREREILMRKSEIFRLETKVKEMWATIIPMQVYSKGNLIKLRIALAKWKKTWQKKETIKSRDLDREMAKKFKL